MDYFNTSRTLRRVVVRAACMLSNSCIVLLGFAFRQLSLMDLQLLLVVRHLLLSWMVSRSLLYLFEEFMDCLVMNYNYSHKFGYHCRN
jgi:hypothetical protein